MPGYALCWVETFRHCKVFILTGICVTGGLPLVLERLPLVLEHTQELLGDVGGLVQAEADTVGALGMSSLSFISSLNIFVVFDDISPFLPSLTFPPPMKPSSSQ